MLCEILSKAFKRTTDSRGEKQTKTGEEGEVDEASRERLVNLTAGRRPQADCGEKKEAKCKTKK